MPDVMDAIDQVEEEIGTEVTEAGDAEGGVDPAPESQPAEEGLVVSIGEDPEPEEAEGKAPTWVKAVRKQNRELSKELRELKRKLNESGQTEQPVQLGEKPTLQDHDYDTERFEKALADWYEKKRAVDEKAARVRAEAETAEQKWKAKVGAYQQAKASLGAEDYEEAEAVVQETLDATQQGIIVHGAKDAALVLYALGKNPGKAKELAGIKDPVEFAFAVARLEATLKVSGKKPATPPEPRITGSGRPSGTVDSALARLRAEAEKTGDYTKVMEYKRQLSKKR